MNLAPVQVEHAHGHGALRPVNVSDKPDRANSVSRVGMQFPNDAGRPVKELDAKLHRESRAVVGETLRWRPANKRESASSRRDVFVST
jgi:hypothetical protein